jgi:hypothetical protein
VTEQWHYDELVDKKLTSRSQEVTEDKPIITPNSNNCYNIYFFVVFSIGVSVALRLYTTKCQNDW